MDAVIGFLERNGFEPLGDEVWSNGVCKVYWGNTYTVEDVEGGTMHSTNLNIYWLVGVLTWRGLIDKDYLE